MRLAAMGMMLAAAAGAWGAETGAPAARSVTVCVSAGNSISTAYSDRVTAHNSGDGLQDICRRWGENRLAH